MSSFEIIIGVVILLMTVAAWMVSTRRNRRTISEFDFENLDQLKICLSDWHVQPVEKKLGKIGWQLTRTEHLRKGQVQVWFKQTSDEAALPLREVLNSLNRAGYLNAGPIELKKDEEQPPS